MLFIIMIGHLIQVFGKAYGSLASYMERVKHMVLTESAFKAESSDRKKGAGLSQQFPFESK